MIVFYNYFRVGDYVVKDKSTKATLVVGISFVLGVFLLALNYNLFLLPNNYVVSGMSGIAIAFEELIGFNATLFIYLTNGILLVMSFIFLGIEKTRNTIVGTILYPLMITFTAPIAKLLNCYFPLNDTFLVIVFAAVLYGLSNGLIYKCGYTTGGNDVLMQMLNKYFKIPESKALTFVNAVVIIFGGLTFGYMKAIYATIILILSSMVIDKIMFGLSDSKLFYIYTREEEKVKKTILEEIQSGFTIIPTKGGYSHTKGCMIMCVVPNRDYYIFKNKILEIDPTAFFVIESCYEVNGGVKRSNLRFLE